MKKYLGVKLISAEPMTHGQYSIEKYGESTNTEFSIQNRDSEGYKVVYDDGYVSWSPKEAFEKAYRPITDMTFGLAVEAMKKGFKVAKRGWNGKGMYVVLQKGYPNGIAINKNTQESLNLPEGTIVGFRPYLMMACPIGSTNHFGNTNNNIDCVPWLPSCTDIIAEDWYIVASEQD